MLLRAWCLINTPLQLGLLMRKRSRLSNGLMKYAGWNRPEKTRLLWFRCYKAAHVELPDRNHWRERIVPHRRIYESEMGPGKNPVRKSVGRLFDRQTGRARSRLPAATRARASHPPLRAESSRKYLGYEKTQRGLDHQRQCRRIAPGTI